MLQPDPTTRAPGDGRLVLLFALTIFVSAYLLFQVQPLISKFILPWFGGSPTVWTAAMLFFQCVLFGGYVYAHLLTRHGSPHVQAGLHLILLLAAAALALWVVPDQSLKPTGEENPIGQILVLLGVSVGLPYFCLATTGPLIQYWFTRVQPGRSAFRLYALSNFGSFLALLSFPYLFEPFFSLPQLGRYWTLGFWLFAALCAAVTLHVWRLHRPRKIEAASAPTAAPSPDLFSQPTLTRRLGWVALPALASLTFIATTDHVSHDIAPEPRLWIATLSLYLLTFIICFDHPRWYRRPWIAAACVVGVVLLTGRDDIPGWFGLGLDYGLTGVRWSHLGVMFLICLISHGELYRRRPTNPKYLTEFYLWMSFGGACGGLFVALVATNVFADYYEWTLCLLAAVGLGCFVLAAEWRPGLRHAKTGAALATLALGALVFFWQDPFSWRNNSGEDYADVQLHQSRNFYGTVSVIERRYPGDPSRDRREFYSGQIIHGTQYLAADKRRLPVAYFSPGSGVGETIQYAMARRPSLRVAIIGLGAGTMANYARATDDYDFYEINPEAVAVARKWFDNLAECRARTQRMLVGDARLKLETLPDDLRYDIIMLDAFTGDSVPMHLLTQEAFQIYRRHLQPNGFIVINITNSYLNLYPVVRRQAEALGMGFRNKYQASNMERYVRRNHFFIMTNDRDYLQSYPSLNRKHYDDNGALLREDDPNLPGVPLWTDQFSSLGPIELDN